MYKRCGMQTKRHCHTPHRSKDEVCLRGEPRNAILPYTNVLASSLNLATHKHDETNSIMVAIHTENLIKNNNIKKQTSPGKCRMKITLIGGGSRQPCWHNYWQRRVSFKTLRKRHDHSPREFLLSRCKRANIVRMKDSDIYELTDMAK